MKLSRRHLMQRSGAALAATSLAPVFAQAKPPAGGNPLATKDQLATEAMAMRLFQSAPVRAAMARSRAQLQADERARTRSGAARLGLYVDEMSFLACTEAAARNADHPSFTWTLNLPHRWFGRDVPGSRSGVDNPDNAYRMLPIEPQAAYVITGRVPPTPAANVSFNVFDEYPGNGADSRSLGTITLADLALGPDRSFRLTADATPAAGRANHLQLAPAGKLIFVRDSMADWARETPLALKAERVSGPAPQPLREAALAEASAAIIDKAQAYWSQMMARYYFFAPPNKLTQVQNLAFVKGRQFTMNSHFRLAPDEAYVLTLDPMGVKYVGLQLSDLWGASLDYARHTASLSNGQVRPNPDGAITYVLSLNDPGVHNWLDPTGLEMGTFMFRYQGFDPAKVQPRPETAIRQEAVVKLADLDHALPPGTPRVTAEGRRQQLAARLAAYNRRIAEAPMT